MMYLSNDSGLKNGRVIDPFVAFLNRFIAINRAIRTVVQVGPGAIAVSIALPHLSIFVIPWNGVVEPIGLE